MPPYSAKGIPNAKSSTVADGPLQATDIGAKMTPSEDKQGAAGTSTPNGASATLFQCSGFGDCHMVFTRSEHLARHVRYVSKTLTGRKHTGERPFKCHCHKAFSRLDNLRQHCQTVHSDTPEHNEEVLRKLTVLHSNLATSAAKNQRSFARVVSPDEYKSDEEVASPHPVHGKKWEAPSHGTSSLGHLAGMHSRAGHEEMERRYSQAAPTSAPYVPVLPPLRSKSAPHMFRSEVPAPPRTSQLGLRGASPPYSRFARTVPYMGSSGVMMRPSVSSPKASLSRDASMESSVELRPSNMLPPLSELSSRAGPRAQHDPRAHSSRSFPLPTRERSPSLSAARRASIPLVENPFHPTSPNPSYRHGYTSSKYGPPMHPDPRSASLYGPGRHGVPPYFPSPASHRSKRPESSLSTDSIESYATSHEPPADALLPANPVSEYGPSRPTKKSRSSYFPDFHMHGPIAPSPDAFRSYEPTNAVPGLPPPATAARPSQLRCRGPNGALYPAYTSSPYNDVESVRHRPSQRWNDSEESRTHKPETPMSKYETD